VVAEGLSVKLPVTGVMVSAMVVVAVSAPDVPVIVTVEVPAVAVLLAVNVTTLVAVAGLVPNVAVTPLGSPDAARVTLPANGLTSATVMVSVPLEPCAMDRVAAEALSEKLPVTGVIVSAMMVVAVSAPDVPVIVTVDVPAVAVLLAVNVTTLVAVAGLVPNVAVTPLGRPEAVSDTLPVNPPTSVTAIESVPLLPWAIVSAVGVGVSVNFSVGGEEGGVPVPMMMPRPFVPR
jgi:hypothetical protein